MKNTVRIIVIGYILSIMVCIPFVVSGQSSVSVMVSGNGQLRTIPYDPIVDGLVTYDSFLPQYKPLLKSVIIKMYRLFSDYGELKRTEESYTTSVMYDRNGNVVEVLNSSFNKSVRIRYESNRIVELKHGDNPKFRYVYIYDSNGRLSTILHGEWTNKCNLDSNGNIVSVKDYYGVNEYENHITYQYDSDHRMIAFHDNGSNKKDIYWNYDKKGNLISYRETKYLKNGEKKEEHEYRFEYGLDGNPTRCVAYIIGDITKIDCGYEYEYTYSYYLSPEEQRRQDSLRLEKQKEAEVLAQKTQRQAKYIPCQFLFESEEAFASCVSNDIGVAEQEIKQLIVKKMQYISTMVLSGKELRDHNNVGTKEMLQICEMCRQLKDIMSRCDEEEKGFVEHIYNYTEYKLGDFISGKNALKKAYKKSPNSENSLFLISYIQGNNDSNKSGDNVGNKGLNKSLLWPVLGLVITSIAYYLYLNR